VDNNPQRYTRRFRKPTSIICNRYALRRGMFRKWACRSIYSSVVCK